MNNQAIGETSLTIKTLLKNALGNPYVVTLHEPWSNFGNTTGVNLYLYKVEANAQMKNLDWFGSKNNPAYNNHPPLSLDLYYMLTPYAFKTTGHQTDEAETHRLLGMAMHFFHEYPVLNDIHSGFFDADKDEHLPQDLKNSLDKIKITLLPANLEEMSKIWSLGNHPYKLSVCYHVSVIQIEPTVPPSIAKDVEKIELEINDIKAPFINNIDPQKVKAEGLVLINGINLKGTPVIINLDDSPILLNENTEENKLQFMIPKEYSPGKYNLTVTIDGRISNKKILEIIV